MLLPQLAVACRLQKSLLEPKAQLRELLCEKSIMLVQSCRQLEETSSSEMWCAIQRPDPVPGNLSSALMETVLFPSGDLKLTLFPVPGHSPPSGAECHFCSQAAPAQHTLDTRKGSSLSLLNIATVNPKLPLAPTRSLRPEGRLFSGLSSCTSL